MTDLELLVAAAKAAGIPILVWGAKGSEKVADMSNEADYKIWNPLADDGDALRLACDLGLQVFPVARTPSGLACSAVGSVTGARLSRVADLTLDTRAATRRAIVMAAAELGREQA